MTDEPIAHPDLIPTLEAQIADIEERRSPIATAVAAAAQTMSDLQGQQDEAATKFAAGGKHDPAKAAALAAKVREAEATQALARNAANILDASHRRATDLLGQCVKIKASEDHASAVAAAKALGAVFDAKAEELNAAFDAWKEGVLAAAAKWPAHILRPDYITIWPSQGPGIIGARPLHPDILASIEQLRGLSVPRGRVADFQ